MADKVYFNGLSIKQGKYGLRVSVNVEKFVAELEHHKNQRGYVNIDVKERKEIGRFGESHSASLDTWSPNAETTTTPAASTEDAGDLPF